LVAAIGGYFSGWLERAISERFQLLDRAACVINSRGCRDCRPNEASLCYVRCRDGGTMLSYILSV